MMKKYILLLLLIAAGSMPLTAQTLTLEECKAYALEHNRSLKEARYHVEASEQAKKNAFTHFFPSLSAQAGAMRSSEYLLEIETPEMDLPVYDGDPSNLANPTQFSYIPSMEIEALDYLNIGMVTATQPIYTGGRIRTGYNLAELGREINQEQLNLSTDQVIVQTEEYYWNLISVQAKRNTLERYETLLDTLLKDVQASYEAGLTQKSDLLKVKLKINEMQSDKLKLENGIEIAKMALAQHIGITYSDSLKLADSEFQVTPPSSIYTDPERALIKRSEYQLLNKAVDAKQLQKKMIRGEFLPQLALGVQGQYLDIADNDKTFGLVFATLSIPISDLWSGSYKIQEQQIKVNIAQNDLAEKSELLQLQINRVYKQLLESYQQISVAESRAAQAREHLNVVNDNYDAGVVSTSDLLEAQVMHQEAQDALVDSKSTYQIRRIHYLKAIAKISYSKMKNE